MKHRGKDSDEFLVQLSTYFRLSFTMLGKKHVLNHVLDEYAFHNQSQYYLLWHNSLYTRKHL